MPEQPKLSSSATQNIGPKPSGAGSTYSKRTVGTDADPLGGRRPGDGHVPNSALSVETLTIQCLYGERGIWHMRSLSLSSRLVKPNLNGSAKLCDFGQLTCSESR